MFWNWVGKVDHNFGANDRAFFRWAENKRNEIGNRGNAIRSGPAQDGQLPLVARQPRLVGDWVHIFGAGTVFNMRGGYTYFLEWSQSSRRVQGFDANEFWPRQPRRPASQQGRSAASSRAIEVDEFEQLSRGTSPEPEPELVAPAERVADPRRAQHPQRPRHAVDQRPQRELQQLRRPGRSSTATSPARTLNSTNELEGNAFASFLLGAPSGGSVDVNPKPHYKWFFAAPWIQDDWRVSNKLTLNLGFRWDVNGSVTEEDNMLNYAFDPAIVNPVSARVGQQVMGGIRFAGVNGAPDRPWKLDKNNYQVRVGMAYSINEKTVFRAGYGKYFLNPTSQGNNAGFSLATNVITSNDGGRTPTYLLSNPWPNGIQAPSGSALGARDLPRPRPELLEPRLRRAERAPLLRGHPARAAVAHHPGGHLCGKPQL